MSAFFYCLGSRSNDIKCLAVRLTPFVLYNYLKGGFEENHPVCTKFVYASQLAIETCLIKVLAVEIETTSKQSQEPSMTFPSVSLHVSVQR